METVDETLKRCDDLIKNSQETLKEMKEMENNINFLINEYKTNPGYFRDDDGPVTIEDVIKTTFDFAWASQKLYDLNKSRNNE